MVRWLRPEYQSPAGTAAQAQCKQADMDLGPKDTGAKPDFPKGLPDRIAAGREALEDICEATPEQIARTFKRGRAATVQPLLQSLTALGHARTVEGGRFAM